MNRYNIEFTTKEELQAILEEFAYSESFKKALLQTTFGPYGFMRTAKKGYFCVSFDLKSALACCGALVMSDGYSGTVNVPVKNYTVGAEGNIKYSDIPNIYSLPAAKQHIISDILSMSASRGGIVLVDRSDATGVLVGMVRKFTSWPEFKGWKLEATASFNNPNHNSQLGLYLWRLPNGQERQKLEDMA